MIYDVVVIGAGPAGYVAAIRAGQLGKKTLLIEKERLGGMCLNWGCIPTKALLESAKKMEEVRRASEFGVVGLDLKSMKFDFKKAADRATRLVKKLTKGVEFLLKKNGVEIEFGEAYLASPNEVQIGNRLISTDHIVLATGSMPELPKGGILADADIFPMKMLLEQERLPQRPVIVGDGPSAVEMAQFFSLVGAEPVLLTVNDRYIPNADPLISANVEQLLKNSHVTTGSYHEAKFDSAEKRLRFGERVVSYDSVINLADRRAVLPPMDRVNLALTGDGFVSVNHWLQTSQDNIYAVGDMNGLSAFAHAASAQALSAVNHLSGVQSGYDARVIPLNLYTMPEMAQVGLGEQLLKEKGMEYETTEFVLSANGKALAEGHREGRVRIYFEPRYGEILGVVIVAPDATDMIAEAVSLIELEATVADAARMIHAHPTISEVMMEAALAAVGSPIHS